MKSPYKCYYSGPGENKIAEAMNSLMDSAFEPLSSHDVNCSFYHYTSVEALMKIVDKDKLWFSEYRFLNDPNEGRIVKEIADKVCDELLNDGIIDDIFCKQIKNSQPFNPELKQPGPKPMGSERYIDRTMFVASFSKKEDDLSLWSYYSLNNGCNIEFEKDDFDDKVTIIEVIYDEKEQKEIMKSVLLSLFNNPVRSEYQYIIHEVFSLILSYLMLSFKKTDHCFENEIRAVYDAEVEKSDLKFRVKNDLMIPYIEVNLKKCKEYNVRCGPLSREKKTWDGVRYFLKTKDKKGKVFPSRTELRY